MNREIENIRVVVGQILDTIAMMDIPINDKNAFGTASGYSVFGCNGNVVKEAETCNGKS